MTMRRDSVSISMAAGSGGGHLEIDVDVARARIVVTGELDFATVQVLREAGDVLMSETAEEITIDLGRLQFIDAAGLGEIVRLRVTLIAAGRRLILSRLSPRIRRTFAMGGLAELVWPRQR